MTNNASNSGLPTGVGGKDTSALNPNGPGQHRADTDRLADGVVRNRHRAVSSTRDVLQRENDARSDRNSDRADRRVTTSGYVSDDELVLDLPDSEERALPDPRPIDTNRPLINAFSVVNALTPHSRDAFNAIMIGKQQGSTGTTIPDPPTTSASSASSSTQLAYMDDDVVMVSSIDDVYEIPRVVINLALARMHVPLTLLTAEAIEWIHTDPSSFRMKKGIVSDDPKKSVMDPSTFPPETSLSAAQFGEASENFINLLAHVASPLIIERFK
ncbi:uncharacterized protein EDB91DRAFT_698514 [Suillus paluster]|uniref:uncharacterized protein n=1 Tax=Suillus paluster TaxID=48578 RepID=UPI001B886512|nr:uncharacterized protein EDB91DRAFT_698514 [Suillus paluster]KAG1750608.1 hypothetical protein EDB91DRAFT_698514 [Suillus paluster]